MARLSNYSFPSRSSPIWHNSTRQFARIMSRCVKLIDVDPYEYSKHSQRRKKATLIYRCTKSLRTVRLLMGHAKLESNTRYFDIEVVDALGIFE